MSKAWPLVLVLALFSAASACSADEERVVERVLGPLPAALLSVSAADGELWIAGASDELGAFLARRVGPGPFERVDLRGLDVRGGALWWVDARAGAAVGERGRMFLLRPELVAVETGTTTPLYGVAGDGDRLYAVGGPPATLIAVSGGVAREVRLPDGVPSDVRLFKVFFDGEAFHAVGERGVVLRIVPSDSGESIIYRPVPGAPRLVTVHGRAGVTGSLLAVGGASRGYAVELGDGARLIEPGAVAPLSGVAVGTTTLATGFLGLLLERRGDAWHEVPGLGAMFDGHAVTFEGEVAWVVGGRLLDGTLRGGELWRVGPKGTAMGSVVDPDAMDAADLDTEDTGPEVVMPVCPELSAATGLELGTRDHAGCFSRYGAGDDATIINGPQGGSHVEVALRFPGPAARVDLSLALSVDGTTIARFEAEDFPTEVDAFDRSARLTTDLPVIFAGADASAWVGREATLSAVVGGVVDETVLVLRR